MTYNAIEREDILSRAGGVGLPEGNFYNHVPDEATLSSSGGATASTGNDGATLDAGTTSGDTAGIDVASYGLREALGGINKWKRYITFELEQTLPYSDEVQIGILSGVNGGSRAVVDLKTEQFVVDDGTEVTSALNIAGKSVDMMLLEITFRPDVPEVIFDINRGADTATLGRAPNVPGPSIAAVESNGNGEQVRILSWSDRYIG